MCGLRAKRVGGLKQDQPRLQIRHAKSIRLSVQSQQGANLEILLGNHSVSEHELDAMCHLVGGGGASGPVAPYTAISNIEPTTQHFAHLPTCSRKNGLQNALSGLFSFLVQYADFFYLAHMHSMCDAAPAAHPDRAPVSVTTRHCRSLA